ncbi:suppressor of actin, putative [Entamoeba invadens IP1]|uniref:Suppressor of actin, putative n=1 Tax=Entamoeba invadens IP1 TaxID=370355 RepID=A0A0A1TX08_ENTIV|nr:suppressor of actin, putative [Entamoeba invadens IP1]ELP85825.1 suppressor of actin, putative [Entamoeba invadens IP1]|eukprot:XP_004185171.1 suppressor of actin, putative [Entamoeba invadens IP1]
MSLRVSVYQSGATFTYPNRSPLHYSFDLKSPVSDKIPPLGLTKTYTADELIGFIALHTFTVCVLVKEVKSVTVCNKLIHTVEKIEVVPLPEYDKKKTSEWSKSDLKLFSRIQKMFDDFELFYSHDVNITLTQQRLHRDSSLVDNRFFWNQNMVQGLPNEWVTIFVDGFVKSTISGISSYTLISRRDCSRTGLRFSSRGGDINGNVSNFVETEQIVSNTDYLTSFVQIRGNIPLLWKTNEEDTFAPKGKFYPTIYQGICITRHFDTIEKLYGDILAINLLDNKGAEKELHDMYGFYVQLNCREVKYFPFDFHKECANSKYENVERLIQIVSSDLINQRCFVKNKNNEVIQTQSGVVRTNCIDCLDRTNVVQSSIGKAMLQEQSALIRSGVGFTDNIKNLWADHANLMSKRYTGTNAMKTDYTRSGKRGFKGMMSDGKTSLQRTMISIQTDQYQTPQETLDLLLGKIAVGDLEDCNLTLLCISSAFVSDTSTKAEERKVHVHVTKKSMKMYYEDTGLIWEVMLVDVVACETTHDIDKVLIYTKKTSLPRKLKINNSGKKLKLLSLLDCHAITSPSPRVRSSSLGKINEQKEWKEFNELNLVMKINEDVMEQDLSGDCKRRNERTEENESLKEKTEQRKERKPLPTIKELTHSTKIVEPKLEVGMINWNMFSIFNVPDEQMIKNCVKGNMKDVVVVAVYKCMYETKEKQFESVFDLFKKIFVELNKSEKYVLVAVHKTEDVGQCVLVKKSKYWKVHNAEVSNVYYEKSLPQKFSNLKVCGSAIFLKLCEISVGFLVIPNFVKERDKALYVKGFDLRTEINQIFVSVFSSKESAALEKEGSSDDMYVFYQKPDALLADKTDKSSDFRQMKKTESPFIEKTTSTKKKELRVINNQKFLGLEKCEKKTKEVKENGAIFQRNIFWLNEKDNTNGNYIALSEGREDCLLVHIKNVYCLSSSFFVKDEQKVAERRIRDFIIENIEAIFETKVSTEKGIRLSFVSDVLEQVCETSLTLNKNIRFFSKNVRVNYTEEEIERKWIIAIFMEKENEIGKAIVPLNFLRENSKTEECIIYNDKQRVGTCSMTFTDAAYINRMNEFSGIPDIL